MKKGSMESRFPTSIFAMYLVVLLLMSGIHTGIIVLMNKLQWNEWVQAVIPILYWSLIAVGITVITRWRMQKTYDEPMKQLARASRLVAEGDFSVYVAPIHTSDKADYLDLMIEDFNKMVEELGEPAKKAVNQGMLVEHDLGRLHVRELVAALEKVKAGEEEAKLDVIANAISYTHLLIRHIDKEDRVIYKFAERNLNDEVIKLIDDECENYEINNEEIKNKYISILEELEKRY